MTFLIDCGEPISGLYKATGLFYDAIDRIFISHMHCDHIGGFFMLIQGFWLENRQKDLIIHMPLDGIGPIRQLLDAACIFDELYGFRLNFEALKAGQPMATHNVRVTPYPTCHLESLRKAFQSRYPQAFESFCFLLESDHFRVGHSADIGVPEDLAPLVEKPLDLLVCELAHCKAEDLFGYLSQFSIKRIIFMHLGRRYWSRLEETRYLATKILGRIPFAFARDSEEFAL